MLGGSWVQGEGKIHPREMKWWGHRGLHRADSENEVQRERSKSRETLDGSVGSRDIATAEESH